MRTPSPWLEALMVWLRGPVRGILGIRQAEGLCVFVRPGWPVRLMYRSGRNRRSARAAAAARNTDRIWSKAMAQVCEVCGKGPQFGNNISHAHNVTKRRWNVNLQSVKALVNGSAKRIRVCTSCIKAGKITKA